MDDAEKELIYSYLTIDNRINWRLRRIKLLEEEFSYQNYYGSTRFTSEGTVRYFGFRLESKVCGHVAQIAGLERSITKLEKRKVYFKRYLSTLSIDRLRSLERRYLVKYVDFQDIHAMPSDKHVIEEIKEIEEAINFEFGGKKLFRMNEFNEMEVVVFNDEPSEAEVKAAEIEEMDIVEDNTEDVLEAMFDLLGV